MIFQFVGDHVAQRIVAGHDCRQHLLAALWDSVVIVVVGRVRLKGPIAISGWVKRLVVLGIVRAIVSIVGIASAAVILWIIIRSFVFLLSCIFRRKGGIVLFGADYIMRLVESLVLALLFFWPISLAILLIMNTLLHTF